MFCNIERFCSVLAATAAVFVASASAQQGPAKLPSMESWSRMPITFVENRGQYESGVRFAARRAGMESLLMDDGFFVRFTTFENDGASSDKLPITKLANAPRGGAKVRGSALRFRFEGCGNAQIDGAQAAEGKVNYLIGDDRERWIRGARGYRSVQYKNIYPGIDALFHEDGGTLKYDILIAPGAPIGRLRLLCEGADSLTIDPSGALVASNSAGEFRQAKPVTFEISPTGEKIPVETNYELLQNGGIGFKINNYNPNRPLVIDPGIVYGTFVGGNGSDAVQDIAVDAAGNAYITGFTGSTNFPVKGGAFLNLNNGNFDAFVTKIKPDGSDFVFSTYLGGVSIDQGVGVAVDAAFNVYICGSTLSVNFPTSPAAVDKTFSFGVTFGDAFVTKLRNDGGDILASTFLGGAGEEIALKIGIDTQLNVYVTGWTRSGTLDFPTENGFQTFFGGSSSNDLGDAFLTKFTATLSGRMYSTYLGGSGNDGASGLAVDPVTGKAYICGIARSTFPTKGLAGSTALSTTIKSNGDAFIACIDTNQAAAASLVFSGFLGGAGIDSALDIARDGSGALYATGYTESPDFPTKAGSFDTTYNNSIGKVGDAWIAKLNSTGTQFGYATFIGGNAQDAGTSIAVDSTGSAYICGRTLSGDFPKVIGAVDSSYNGKLDGFVLKMNPAGTAVAMANFIGGINDDNAIALALRVDNDVYIGGSTLSAFLAANAGFDTSINSQDGFVLRLDLGPVSSLCLSSDAAMIVSHTFGNAATDVLARTIQNCGSLDSVLNWTLGENPDATWLSESLTSGTVNFGAGGDSVNFTFDPAGLPLGAHKTTLQFTNTDNLTNTKLVPVTFVIENGTVIPFIPGDTLSGAIDFESESDLGSFSCIKGATLQIGIATTSGDLKPIVSLLDNVGTVVKSYTFANTSKAKKKNFIITADGNYQIKVSGVGATAGGYTMTTKLTLPKDAKAVTKKKKAPAVGGLPIDTKVRFLAGATLNVTVEPATTLGAAITIVLLDPSNAPIDVTAFTQVFNTNGKQLVNVPIAAAGQYTIRVTGPTTVKEKVNIVITPTQPVGTSQVTLQ